MSASFLPSIFVPFIGFVFPFLVLGSFLVFVEKDTIN
uniref:Photosystem I reaction center subunit VIII n=1 Tax=Euglena archaeoplastidiata TaxID=1188008 RepID=A0A1X9GCL6_9EUGL|nr:photosystem I 4 kDa hydrophobic subunit [Euglena archaeoplastidiata]AKR17878.1 photosystem I 4 kDa hydrophobic subunit [Euglena archaeoplastidiata]